MARFFKKREQTLGQAPGSLIFVGTQKVGRVGISHLTYNVESLEEGQNIALPERPEIPVGKVIWYNVDGLHDPNLMMKFRDFWKIHPLIMEDVMNTGQRSKVEEIDEHLFVTLKMLRLDEEKLQVTSEQISLVVHPEYLISFQEHPEDVFEPVRQRIRSSQGRIRRSGTDYLLYALLDTIVDSYIVLIERVGEKIEALEEDLLDRADDSIIPRINTFKKELNFLSKVIRPVKDMIRELNRSEHPLLQKRTFSYLSDLNGLILHAVETIDSYRTMLNDFLDMYNSDVSNRMNDVMKVLTIFASIFIPLTFLAGIYGMNFQYMPELGWKYGYFSILGVMLLMAVGMLWFFRRKRWL